MNILRKIKLFLFRLLHKEEWSEAQNFVFYINGKEALPEPLDSEEELVLLEETKNGSKVARDKLIEHNIRLVVYIAKKFENSGMELDDLISIGAIGLIKWMSHYLLTATEMNCYLPTSFRLTKIVFRRVWR